jgi:RNA polymerase sigma factor (sigma-70 family)
MREIIRHLRRAALLQGGDGPSDAQLLESFVVRREEIAFEALLRRHGPMVLGVCRRILRNVYDAEDAFQATFLVLARKAGSVMPREMVGGWLYGVAYRTALKARTMNAKRRTKERQAGEMPRSKPSADEELLEQLDHELSRLPDKYRVPIVLCELEGASRKEAARMLAIPEGTLSWRLAHAKKMLAKRLSRHELAIPLGALAVGLSPALRASTLKTALTAGAVPAKVLALTEGVIKAMLLTKLKVTVCVAALALVAGVGATGLTYRAMAEEPKRYSADEVFSIRVDDRRPAGDDMEALRLEIEALRKELRATKERVKALEDERRGQRGQNQNANALQKQAQQNFGDWVRGVRVTLDDKENLRERKEAAELRARAEAALMKLAEKTDDKQAIQLLEQALKLLKEREALQRKNEPERRSVPLQPQRR